MEDIKIIFYVLLYLYWLFSIIYVTGRMVYSKEEISYWMWAVCWILSCTLGWFITPIMLGFKLSKQHSDEE